VLHGAGVRTAVMPGHAPVWHRTGCVRGAGGGPSPLRHLADTF